MFHRRSQGRAAAALEVEPPARLSQEPSRPPPACLGWGWWRWGPGRRAGCRGSTEKRVPECRPYGQSFVISDFGAFRTCLPWKKAEVPGGRPGGLLLVGSGLRALQSGVQNQRPHSCPAFRALETPRGFDHGTEGINPAQTAYVFLI